MLNLGLESRHNVFDATIEGCFVIRLRCCLRMNVPDRESSLLSPKGLLLSLLVVSLAIGTTRRYGAPMFAGGFRVAPEVVRLFFSIAQTLVCAALVTPTRQPFE